MFVPLFYVFDVSANAKARLPDEGNRQARHPSGGDVRRSGTPHAAREENPSARYLPVIRLKQGFDLFATRPLCQKQANGGNFRIIHKPHVRKHTSGGQFDLKTKFFYNLKSNLPALSAEIF